MTNPTRRRLEWDALDVSFATYSPERRAFLGILENGRTKPRQLDRDAIFGILGAIAILAGTAIFGVK